MKSLGIAVSMLALSISIQQSGRVNSTVKTTETLEAVSTSSLSFSAFTRLKSHLSIFAGSATETGQEPWISNGTSEGTALLVDIFPGPQSSNAQGFTRYAGEVFFYADDGVHGMEVWRTDGTQKGTKLLKDLVPGADGMRPTGLSVVDHHLYIPVDAGKGGKLTFYVLYLDLSRSFSDE